MSISKPRTLVPLANFRLSGFIETYLEHTKNVYLWSIPLITSKTKHTNLTYKLKKRHQTIFDQILFWGFIYKFKSVISRYWKQRPCYDLPSHFTSTFRNITNIDEFSLRNYFLEQTIWSNNWLYCQFLLNNYLLLKNKNVGSKASGIEMIKLSISWETE